MDTIRTSRPLGTNQRLALDALRRHGLWPRNWILDTHSNTVRVLDSLVARDLVDVRNGVYTLSSAGANLVSTWSFQSKVGR